MNNLLELFSTDRGLLDSRGSLIIRQLCLNLNTERIYRTFAEILEKEEVRSSRVWVMSANAEQHTLGSGVRQRHGSEAEYDPNYFAGIGGVPQETEES